jgi:peptidoglycan/xylan/chitin deacetylase (PgdA/CDA1 family)
VHRYNFDPMGGSEPSLKRRALRLFAGTVGLPLGTAAALALRVSARKVGVAVMYHGVVARPGAADHELVPAHSARVFERQVRYLRRRYRVVPAGALSDAIARRRRGERFPASITFDDDLDCHATVALPILRRLGAPATFFLSGASLDAPHAFWWERLDRAVALGVGDPHTLVGAPPGNLREVGLFVEELDPEERDTVAERLRQAVGPDPPESGIRRDAVRALSEAGMSVGFHTLRHDALTLLTDDQLRRGLVDGRTELEHAAAAPVDTIGYPHGRADARVAAAAGAVGFRAGFTTRHEAITPATDPLLQGRVGPSFHSAGALALELAFIIARAGTRRSRTARERPPS